MNWISPSLAAEFATLGTDAYRIADGEECRIERYGDGAIISHAAESLPWGVAEALFKWGKRAKAGLEGVYARRLVTAPGRSDTPRSLGRPSHQHTCIAHEEGLCYEIDFLAGYSCGLFLDQRANRRKLRVTKAERILNLFSYTCSFSVAAAVGGAQTLSIDVSKAALDRGRRNFALNALPLEGHRFMADDAFDVLPRLARRGEKFEAIVVDPPTFSRGRNGRLFRAERDYGRLIELAFACAVRGGVILLSTNCSQLDRSWLETLGKNHVPVPVTFFATRALPDIPTRHGAATVWMQV
ncbi:MAG TPA: class I SAM-dependent methyltransferase [Terrimicrobiaceae bacterium]|nr:class I SAM-dependent methyltransferase [Terrimicrobiaceae bacterium]